MRSSKSVHVVGLYGKPDAITVCEIPTADTGASKGAAIEAKTYTGFGTGALGLTLLGNAELAIAALADTVEVAGRPGHIGIRPVAPGPKKAASIATIALLGGDRIFDRVAAGLIRAAVSAASISVFGITVVTDLVLSQVSIAAGEHVADSSIANTRSKSRNAAAFTALSTIASRNDVGIEAASEFGNTYLALGAEQLAAVGGLRSLAGSDEYNEQQVETHPPPRYRFGEVASRYSLSLPLRPCQCALIDLHRDVT